MKIRIVKSKDTEDYVEIHCLEVNDEIKKIIEFIESTNISFIGKDTTRMESSILKLKDIYYFEAVDNKVFAYLSHQVFEVDKKIAELNEELKATSFIQISRTVILNINTVKKITTLVNGRMLVVLNNNEKLIITRLYAKSFKDKLKGGKANENK